MVFPNIRKDSIIRKAHCCQFAKEVFLSQKQILMCNFMVLLLYLILFFGFLDKTKFTKHVWPTKSFSRLEKENATQ